MKKPILILTLALLVAACNQATKQKQMTETDSSEPVIEKTEPQQAQEINSQLEEIIVKTIKAWQNKDEKTLNKLILKDFGIAFLYKPGAFVRIAVYDRILFDNPDAEYTYMPHDFQFESDYKINFEELPDFDCDKYEWNKPIGIYCDIKNIDKKLSTTAKEGNEFLENVNWPANKIKKFEEIELKSHKIVVTGKEDNVFAFYVTFWENKWYLTVIDRLEPCSA